LNIKDDLTKQQLNPNRKGALKAAFLAPFCDPNDPKKFNFSQISMTMPPMLFQGLEMAKKGFL